MPENHVSIQRATGVVIQQLQYTDIARAQFHHDFTASGTEFDRDNSQISHMKFRRHVWLPRTATACHRLHAGDNFAEAERLDDEVVGSDFKTYQPIKFLRLRADENDGDVGRNGSNGTAGFVPAVAGLSGAGVGDAAVFARGYGIAMMIGVGLLLTGALVSWFGVGPLVSGGVPDPRLIPVHRSAHCAVAGMSLNVVA